MRERQPIRRSKLDVVTADIDDELYDESREVSLLFRKLPRGLWERHFAELKHIEHEHAGADAETLTNKKSEYLSAILEARRVGIEEYKSNEPTFRNKMPEGELGSQLQELLDSPEGMLGAGMTARVKSMRLTDGETIAVKYLLTPTEKTLSVEGEHDMLYEVETITRIEDEERKLNAGQRIRVPHPHFFYKSEKLQCYGMQEVQGMNLAELFDTNTPNTVALSDRRNRIWSTLRERYESQGEQEALYTELESFTQAMHEICLHGDIKPANMMVDEQGDIYLIDFGQSVDMKTMTDKSREQFENLQELEHTQLVNGIRSLIRTSQAAPQELAA